MCQHGNLLLSLRIYCYFKLKSPQRRRNTLKMCHGRVLKRTPQIVFLLRLRMKDWTCPDRGSILDLSSKNTPIFKSVFYFQSLCSIWSFFAFLPDTTGISKVRHMRNKMASCRTKNPQLLIQFTKLDLSIFLWALWSIFNAIIRVNKTYYVFK